MKLIKEFEEIPAGITLFLGTVILGIIGFAMSENFFALSTPTCYNIIYASVCFIIIVINNLKNINVLLDYDAASFTFKIGIPTLIAFICTAMIFKELPLISHQIIFWLGVISWTFVFIMRRNEDDFFFKLSAAWSISVVFITLGTSIFDYSRVPLTILQNIHILLDIRFNLGIILGVLIFIKSIIHVLNNKKVELKPLFKYIESPHNAKKSPFFDIVYNFFIITSNFIFDLINLFYKLSATSLVYIYFIGGEIYNSISSVLKKSISLLLYIFKFTIIIIAFHFAKQTCDPILTYLRENSWILSYNPLIRIITLSFFISSCMIGFHYIESISHSNKKFKRDLPYFNAFISIISKTLPNLIAMIWLAGIILFCLSRLDFLQFKTFKTFGILSTILTSIALIGFTIYLINNLRQYKQPV